MSIDKWLINGKKNNIKNIDEIFEKMPKEKVQDLKRKKIRKLTQDNNNQENNEIKSNNFLNYLIDFKNWLNQRTYLKGDIEKVEPWINNLYNKLNLYNAQCPNIENSEGLLLIEQYRKIPPTFLDEKIRIAINKKIRGTKRTSSDNYYLKKLKNIVDEKLKEARYYEILKKILESK